MTLKQRDLEGISTDVVSMIARHDMLVRHGRTDQIKTAARDERRRRATWAAKDRILAAIREHGDPKRRPELEEIERKWSAFKAGNAS